MRKPELIHNDKINYIIILKNPIKRFVSAFYHSKYLIDFDTKGYNFNTLVNDISTPYYMLKNRVRDKLKFNNPFKEWDKSDYYKYLFHILILQIHG